MEEELIKKEHETSLGILNALLSCEDTEEKTLDIGALKIYTDGLPKETTINRLIKDTPNLHEVLEGLLEIASYFINSKTSYNNLLKIFKEIISNTEFDYYKETQING
jgi:hypothetical protein